MQLGERVISTEAVQEPVVDAVAASGPALQEGGGEGGFAEGEHVVVEVAWMWVGGLDGIVVGDGEDLVDFV